MSEVPAIIPRLECAFERARLRWPSDPVKWVYLNEVDWAEYDAARSAEWGGPVHCFSFNDVQIRSALRTSRLALQHGILVAIPKRLSPRTKAGA